MIFAQIKQGVLDPYDILSKYSGLTISAATNAKASVCEKCTVILSWASGMNYLAAVNRVSELIRTNKLDSKLRNENYCKTNFGSHATQVIMDAVDSSKR